MILLWLSDVQHANNQDSERDSKMEGEVKWSWGNGPVSTESNTTSCGLPGTEPRIMNKQLGCTTFTLLLLSLRRGDTAMQ